MSSARLTLAAAVAAITLPVASGVAVAADRGSDGQHLRTQVKAISTVTDKDGSTHTRYLTTFGGLPVVGGDFVEHRAASGKLITRSDNGAGRVAVSSITPSITAEQARAAAAASPAQGKDKGKGKGPRKGHGYGLTKPRPSGAGTPSSAPTTTAAAGAIATPATAAPAAETAAAYGESSTVATQLVVLTDGNRPRLAYDVTTAGLREDQTPSRRHTFIDARNAATLASWDDIATGRGDGFYLKSMSFPTTNVGRTRGGFHLADGLGNVVLDLHNSTDVFGEIMSDEDDVWGDGTMLDRASVGVDIMASMREAQAYFTYVLGRNGLYGNGAGVTGRAHYGTNYANAFWDGTQLTVGDGADGQHPLSELDIVAHEWAHGVTQYTAGLIYAGESGGINEATSDIFGAAVEANADFASDAPDYLIGEQIDWYGTGAPLRYLDRPSKDGASPDCWSPSVGSLDVHYSSGPLRHWFYLASEGSGEKAILGVDYDSPTCNGSSMTGAGHVAVEKIWFRALTTYLTSQATYADSREAAILAAKDLYGVGAKECAAVENAFDAIAVPKGTQTCEA